MSDVTTTGADLARCLYRTMLPIRRVGPMVSEALKAGRALEANGASAEVIDVHTPRPLDMDTTLGSVVRTGRLVAVDSDWVPRGVAGEITARAAEECFDALKVPPRRIA